MTLQLNECSGNFFYIFSVRRFPPSSSGNLLFTGNFEHLAYCAWPLLAWCKSNCFRKLSALEQCALESLAMKRLVIQGPHFIKCAKVFFSWLKVYFKVEKSSGFVCWTSLVKSVSYWLLHQPLNVPTSVLSIKLPCSCNMCPRPSWDFSIKIQEMGKALSTKIAISPFNVFSQVVPKRTNRPGISTTDRGFPRARYRARASSYSSSRSRFYSGYPSRPRGRVYRSGG